MDNNFDSRRDAIINKYAGIEKKFKEKYPPHNVTQKDSQKDSESFLEYIKRKFKEIVTYFSIEYEEVAIIPINELVIGTEFKSLDLILRSLGIDLENITKCGKHRIGYEYIAANNERYLFM